MSDGSGLSCWERGKRERSSAQQAIVSSWGSWQDWQPSSSVPWSTGPTDFLLSGITHYNMPHAAGEGGFGWETFGAVRRWAIVLVPALGGLLVGLIIYFAPEADGHGTDAVIDAFHNNQGNIPNKVPFVKMIASALTIGSGGSAGREGPITQIGAGIGSILGRLLKLPPEEVRQLVVIGCGAGLAQPSAPYGCRPLCRLRPLPRNRLRILRSDARFPGIRYRILRLHAHIPRGL